MGRPADENGRPGLNPGAFYKTNPVRSGQYSDFNLTAPGWRATPANGLRALIQIVKEQWRLPPVAFRCLSTSPVLRFEVIFEQRPVGRRPSQGRPPSKSYLIALEHATGATPEGVFANRLKTSQIEFSVC
jgi:hypothetical protein